ncbi:hypothetical protein X777_11230 [Ooceraea biroi]|uniref:Mutator-like transposase domain-containing protein n=1 Tax=Ooceraea biroi TaxID=2015173 RepID=A0A026W266_OOCBI|nr:hypothetical protein X777_11230 [Ooceraea biroi]
MNPNEKVTRNKRALLKTYKSRSKKRKQSFNPKTPETNEASFSASRRKIELQKQIVVPQDNSIEYRILNFVSVFSAIAMLVKCKKCNNDIKFQTTSTRGLGFKIAVLCDQCPPQEIPSCTFINHSYEINRRFIFTMRVLGLGLKGAQKFCGLMDMPKFFYQTTYEIILKHIHSCVKTVRDVLFEKAVKEEMEETDGQDNTKLTVSGDGTWKKRGFTSLFGVASIIGYYSGKVLDVVVKSAFCKMCEVWNKKVNTTEYEEWLENHEAECTANHKGSSGKMEVEAIVEMFKRSETLHGVKYENYIGDGDSKTYSGILNAAPYEDISVNKKECIGHVQKRMGTRLRECKTKNKGLGGKGKLTGKMIDKLTVYYGLAIRRNYESANNMRTAIWATYNHYSSTNENLKHELCPAGAESWCEWQRAYAELPSNQKQKIKSFMHTYDALPTDVLTAIKPIYENLSKQELLDRCVGGFTQNNNESYNQLIWKISPKILPSGSIPIEIAAYVSACVFNEGSKALLQIMQTMGISTGPNAHAFVADEDQEHIATAERRAQANTQEARKRRRQEKIDALEVASAAEGLLYGPGIDDSV